MQELNVSDKKAKPATQDIENEKEKRRDKFVSYSDDLIFYTDEEPKGKKMQTPRRKAGARS